MHRLFILTVTVLLALRATSAFAHFDAVPYVADDQIVTGGHDDGTNEDLPVARVFGYDFGEDPNDPFFAQDPGFNAATGSGLPVGQSLSFNILGSLGYWDGTGAVAFTAPASSESVRLNFGATNRTIDGSSAAQSGFSLGTIGAGGTLHKHLNAFLQGSDGNAVPAGAGAWGAGDGVEAAAGVYLIELQLTVNGASGIADSLPFWIVYNNGLDEELHDEAIDWVQANLVPEPASMALLSLGGLLLWRRRS